MTLIVEVRQQLGDFSLDAAFTSEHGVTALFGRSGSGKTSLVRVIAGLARPNAGRVVLDGDVLLDTARGIFVPRHRRRFGYVFQDARIFPHMTVRQNLGYGRWFSSNAGATGDTARIVDLLGIAALLDRRPAHLSGGERQRVAIGRALLSAPRLLLMDEPLAALDDTRKAEILPYLERLRDEMRIPIIYVSHSVAEVARLADSVVVLAAGKVEAIGAAAEILSDPALSSPGHRRDAGALLEGTVAEVDIHHRLTTIALKTIRLMVPGCNDTVGRHVRVRVPSTDVMLATVRPENISALNVVAGIVVSTGFGTEYFSDVRIDCGGDILHARITELSYKRLGLKPGMPVFAIIKTVALENL